MAPAKVLDPAPTAHPLDPPTKAEIESASAALRTWLLEHGVRAFKIASLFLREPSKYDVIAAGFFPMGDALPAHDDEKDAARAAEPKRLERRVEIHVLDAVTGEAFEASVNVDKSEEAVVEEVKKLAHGVQPNLTVEELCMAEEVIRKDPRVVKAAAEVGIKPENLYADGWSIGWDERFPGRRIQQCLTFARFGKDDNLYARPLDFFPILDNNTAEVLCIDYPSHRRPDGTEVAQTTAIPKQPSFDPPAGRERIPPPMKPHNYLPELATASPFSEKPIEMRRDLKPLSVVQPQGVSFRRDGNVVEWQKWKMHVAFHPREGIVLSTITYKDDEAPGASKSAPKERPLFYRLSLAEMVVPWCVRAPNEGHQLREDHSGSDGGDDADPNMPHWRKAAFDVGEYGIGIMANSLTLGCDCLGQIEYLSGFEARHDGSAQERPQVICIHEEDDGILWKHTDYRVGGRAHNVRARKLVISMVATVANYEYQINYNFHQDGNVELEIKLTGILNMYMLAEGEKSAGFGTEVAPRINAQYHQHLFSLRVDPHIDGPCNSVSEQHVEVTEHPAWSERNFGGNAFRAPARILRTTGEAVRDADASVERSWSFVNENATHYSSGKPVGYKVVCKDNPRLLSQQGSMVWTRAPFARHHIWTVPYDNRHIYPAGRYVPQTQTTPEDSIVGWVGDGEVPIANRDIVSYITLGTTHIPRPEDFPVMPAETVRLHLKPVGFFARSPCLDVPATNDALSVAAEAESGGHAHAAAHHANGNANGNGAAACCARA